jgi:hypothetical protein
LNKIPNSCKKTYIDGIVNLKRYLSWGYTIKFLFKDKIVFYFIDDIKYFNETKNSYLIYISDECICKSKSIT